MVMMTVAIISIFCMIVLSYFRDTVHGMAALGNGTGSLNLTVAAFIDLFITAFGITGSFASVTVLIIVVKAIVGVVRGLKS